MRRRRKITLACLAIASILYVGLVKAQNLYRVRIMGKNDLAYALCSFIACHHGRFPTGLNELIDAGIAIPGENGAMRIAQSDCWEPEGKVYGEPLPAWFLDETAIAWGADLASLKVDGSRVVDSDGNSVQLITFVDDANVPSSLSRIIVEQARRYFPDAP
ncbi:MAG: hypothetical protein KDA33_13655 [Phycisphaerales bacterium]|nr:hypothetical protein [Phycisphaerales bacterium]